MNCGKCNATAPWLTQYGEHWIGPCCLTQEQWDEYPGWKEREELRKKRAAQAKANFGHSANSSKK